MQTKTNNNKVLIDAVTILLLLAAFIFAFIMGFVNKNADTGDYMLSTPIIALISVGGLGILYFSGPVVELVSRIKKDRMNIGFTVLFALSTVAYVALISIMLAVLCEMVTVAAFLPRFIYIFAVVAIIGAYYSSVVYAAALEAESEKPAEQE